jgi:hypothetical protein
MEKEGEILAERQDIFSRVPVLGRLARAAFQLVDPDQNEFVARLLRMEDDKLAQDELAETDLAKVAVPQMVEMQTRQLILIKAKRALRHIELGEDDVEDRIRGLHNFMLELSESASLEDIGLSIYEAETLQMYFSKYCG